MGTANFNILTLGTSGAGKTVFLASMFKQLFSQEEAQFNLKVENLAQRKQLNAAYNQLISNEWPKGTRGYSEWTFTCRVQTKDLNNYTACQFTYFDYAGGRLNDEAFESEFLEMIGRADAILCLLDGHKIYNWLNDKESFKHTMPKWLGGKESSEVAEFLQKELPIILNCVQLTQVPIQFVISKWDILDGQFELELVRDRLLSIPQFKQVVQERSEGGSVVRLIPVSAVGSGFARLEHGEMKRIPGAIPAPKWVEAPIACVLPDQLSFRLNQVKQEEQMLGKPSTGIAGIAGGVFNILGGGLDGLGWLIGNFVNDSSADAAETLLGGIAGLSKRLGCFLQQGAEGRREELEASLKQVKDEQSALDYAIKSFLNIQKELLETYPQSEIAVPSLAAASIEPQ